MEDLLSDLLEGKKSSHSSLGDEGTAQPAVEKHREDRILDGPGPLAVVPVKTQISTVHWLWCDGRAYL